MKLWNFLKSQMMHYSDQLICEEDAKMTYEDFIVWAEQFSLRLKNLHSCAIFCNSEMMAAVALLSCFAANVTAVPLSSRYGTQHCMKILNTISPEAIISDSSGELEVIYITGNTYEPQEQKPALIMCTSGTTGLPKGAMLSETNIMTNVMDVADYFSIDSNDTIFITRPLYHCAVLTGEFLTALVKGCKIQFYSGNFNPPQIAKMLKKFGITVFGGTPTLLSMMARFIRTPEELPLKRICISGECMDTSTGLYIAEVFKKCEIYHVYGLTEACPRVCYLPPELFSTYPDCVGIPLKSVSIQLRKENDKICAIGEEGVLWVKGNNVMLGYYHEPQKTKEVLKKGWLCTGDVGVINEVGLLRIKGRNDDLIIKAGMNIYPAEIESALKTDARVKEVLAYGFENKFGVQIGLKIVGDFQSTEEVKTLCVKRLPSFQVPNYIEILEELPKNGSGKILRKV